jgi:signal transduction histidine kinase
VRRLLGRRIGAQIAFLVIVGILACHAIFTTFVLLERRSFNERMPPHLDLATSVVRYIAALPPDQRAEAIAHWSTANPHVRLYVLSPDMPPVGLTTSRTDEYLRRALAPGIEVEHAAGIRSENSRFTVRLADGMRLAAEVDDGGPPPFPPGFGVLFATLTFVALNLVILLMWASRQLIKPLARIARAAEEFSLEDHAEDLPESGPDEVRTLARALNHMRGRIRAMVEDRTRMLAALGHDLRTPITRLRLKAEFIGDETMRAPILRDLEQMNAMVEGALSYLREGRAGRKPSLADVASLASTICDDFSDMGHNIHYIGPDHLVASVYVEGLQRAITNLAENAVKYGTEVTVALESRDRELSISIADNGPGVTDSEKENLVKPFSRGDNARSLTGQKGFGLGLAIADAVARAHHGRLLLLNNTPCGLLARLDIEADVSESGNGRKNQMYSHGH